MSQCVPGFAVPQVRLGRSDVYVPVIGQGTYKYEGGVEPLRYGIELGATLIDTAEIYGTEMIVGEACADTSDVFIISKVWKTRMDCERVVAAANGSMERLGQNWIDLYMVHFPVEHVPLRETMTALEWLQRHGGIKYIGVCNFTLDQLKEAQDCLTDARIEAVQYRYNLNRREIERDILPYCQANDITVMAYEPLDQGRLGNKAKEALQFVIRQGCIALVRSSNTDHIKANIEAVCEVA